MDSFIFSLVARVHLWLEIAPWGGFGELGSGERWGAGEMAARGGQESDWSAAPSHSLTKEPQNHNKEPLDQESQSQKVGLLAQ